MKAETYSTKGERKTDLRNHLRTTGLLAKWPLIGLTIVLVGTLLFGGMVWNLETQGPLIQVDQQVSVQLHTIALHSPPYIVSLGIFGSLLGKEVTELIALTLGLYFFFKRYWRELAMVVIGFSGEGALFELLSRFFNRHRPVFQKPIWEVLPGPGFPSGHTATAIVCYGFLAYLLVPKMPNRLWKGVVIILSLLIIAYIGVSRIFVGDHYLTDVLAGYGMGLAWAGLVYTIVEKIWERKNSIKPS